MLDCANHRTARECIIDYYVSCVRDTRNVSGDSVELLTAGRTQSEKSGNSNRDVGT